MFSLATGTLVISTDDEEVFAENMWAVLRDPVTARKIGDPGRQVCKTQIHYKAHSRRLADFFTTCIRSAK